MIDSQSWLRSASPPGRLGEARQGEKRGHESQRREAAEKLEQQGPTSR
jgi:hypothetical protein